MRTPEEIPSSVMDAGLEAAYGPSKMGDCSGWVAELIRAVYWATKDAADADEIAGATL